MYALAACGPELPVGPEEQAAFEAEEGTPSLETVELTLAGCSGPIALTSGTTVSNISAEAKAWSCTYTLNVPAGAANLRITTQATSSGDSDMYVRLGSEPNQSFYDWAGTSSTSYEEYTHSTPQAGTWYVKLYAYSAFSGVKLTASFTPSGPAGCTSTTTLSNGTTVGNIGVSAGSWSCIYQLYVPVGSVNLKFVTSGGSGNGDVYVRRGSVPNDTTYDCKSAGYSNSETCTIAAPQEGVYYVRVYANSTFSGVNLTGSYSLEGLQGCTTTSEISNGVSVNNVSAPGYTWSCTYTLFVPAGATNLKFVKNGYSGTGQMYVKYGSAPTLSSYDCNYDTCTIPSPQAGIWYVKAYASTSSGISGWSLKGSYTGGGSGTIGGVLQNGVTVTNLSGAAGSNQYWTMDVPADTVWLYFSAAYGSGDMDMYIGYNAPPTESSYLCRSALINSNGEICRVDIPRAGRYYVMLKGTTAWSGVQLSGLAY